MADAEPWDHHIPLRASPYSVLCPAVLVAGFDLAIVSCYDPSHRAGEVNRKRK